MNLIMQNKANFRKAQMNVNSFIKKDYRKNDAFAVQKNKPNSNPIKANLRKAKMDVNFYSTKDYENEPRLRAPGKQTQSNPISNRKAADNRQSSYRSLTVAALLGRGSVGSRHCLVAALF